MKNKGRVVKEAVSLFLLSVLGVCCFAAGMVFIVFGHWLFAGISFGLCLCSVVFILFCGRKRKSALLVLRK